jgi:hypothetical protein
MADSRRDRVDARLEHMRQEFAQLEPLFKELRDNFMPSRGRFAGEQIKDRIRHRLPNSTPLFAARTLGSGLHAGLTSPARPWLKSAIQDDDLAEYGPVKEWLALVDQRTLATFARSNLYQALPAMYTEYGTVGTMCGVLFDDPDTVIRVEPYTVGSYKLARNAQGVYDTLYRCFPMTVRQVVTRFGEKAVSPEVLRMWKNEQRREEKVQILHTLEPEGQEWASCYWEAERKDGPRDGLLKRARLPSNRILAASWEGVWGETYASSCPGMLALGDAKALQVDERSKARAIERHHNPPMQGPGSLRGGGISLAPGAMNWVDVAQATGQNGHIRPVHDFRPDLAGIMDNLGRGEGRVNQAYFVDLFLMLTLDERAQRATAEEIRAKYDEKVLALGPTLENGNAMLRTLYNATFQVMVDQSRPIWEGRLDGTPLLPPPPREIADSGVEILPEFVSALQQAQRAQALQGIERFMSMAGTVAQFTGKPPEKADFDQILDEYASGLSVPPKIVRDDEEVAAMREAEAQAAQMQQMAAMAPALKDAATAATSLAQTQPAEGNLLAALGGGL